MSDDNLNIGSASDETPSICAPSGEVLASADPTISRIEFLSLKAKALFDRLQRLVTQLNVGNLRQMDEYDLRGMLRTLTELKANFVVAHDRLEEQDFRAISSELPGQFDSAVLQLETILERELGKLSQPAHCSTFRMNLNESQSLIYMANRSRLPQLQLPKFSGEYTEWTSFDSEAELTSIENLQHLRCCLSGVALDTISSLEMTEDNYRTALDILKARFANKRLILQAHIRA